jgi:hypothetical protein
MDSAHSLCSLVHWRDGSVPVALCVCMAWQTHLAAMAMPRLPPAIWGGGDSPGMAASARCRHKECAVCGSGRALFALYPGFLVHLDRTPYQDGHGALIRDCRPCDLVRFMSGPFNKDAANLDSRYGSSRSCGLFYIAVPACPAIAGPRPL